MKKTWTKPELIVIFRGKPEENVLCACKYPAAGPYPNSQGSCPNSGPHSCKDNSPS
jgi:hypothetical protein